MSNFQTSGLPALVIIGELKDKRASFGNSFDPSYSITEGQFRALYMRLNRLLALDQFQFNSVYEIDGNDSVYFVSAKSEGRIIVYAIVLKLGNFTESLKSVIQQVATRGGIYTAKRFYEEITDHQSNSLINRDMEEISYDYALELIAKTVPSEENIEILNRVMKTIANQQIPGYDNLFHNLKQLLEHLTTGLDIDIILDHSFTIANQYYHSNIYDKAWELYLLLAKKAENSERLALMISSRLRATVIAREMNKDIEIILGILNEIDDGSLEVASQEEREQYYSMQGYCHDKLGQTQMAEDFHHMAVMISESETSPSIYIAESHAYLGRVAGERYQPENATREYLTASTIAMAQKDRHRANLYSHKAATYELQWSNLLSSTAVVMDMNSDAQNAEFYAWQSLKRLVNCISHSDRTLRKSEILDKSKEIIRKNRTVLPETSEYAITTLKELENQLNFISDGVLPVDQEKELLNFISTKISAMLPLPPPVVLLIANDGRLIIGGEVGAERWDESILANDDLFSGALSAIMAILSEVISGDNPLRMLDAGQTQIMIEKSDVCIGALLVDRDLNILRKALRDTVTWMETEYPNLGDWDGYSIDFSGVKPKVEEIFEIAMENIAN